MTTEPERRYTDVDVRLVLASCGHWWREWYPSGTVTEGLRMCSNGCGWTEVTYLEEPV